MSGSLSRREFLKLSSTVLGGLALPSLDSDVPSGRPIFEYQGLMARVATHSISVFNEPDIDAKTVDFRFEDELLNVYYEVEAETPVYNTTWYRVWGGWIHSAFVQKTYVRYNAVMAELPKSGLQLSEVSTPYTQPWSYDRWLGWQVFGDFRLYYGSTHWIVDIVEGPDKHPWYMIEDELYDGFNYYVPAAHLRPIPDEEMTPISPALPFEAKYVEMDLEKQQLTAYEYDKIVLQTNVSTGIFTRSNNEFPTVTPKGNHNIYSKMPSKHMGVGSPASGDGRPLPGVPWTSFFAEGGYAIHGTYWHNNFGLQMSSGSINMRNEDARFMFRWLTPENDPDTVEQTGYGTQVIIF